MSHTEGIVESLLFASDRPLSVREIKSIMEDADIKEIEAVIESLKQQYDREKRSFQIVQVAGGYQVCSRPQYARWIQGLFRSRARSRLSKPALETLAIIAYKQPILRVEIESIRGVQVDSVLQTLLERNLIAVRGRKTTVGRPLLYGTTAEFLRYFGLNKITDLPAERELRSLIDTSKPTESLVTEYEDTTEQVFGSSRRDIQTSGGSIHPGGTGPS